MNRPNVPPAHPFVRKLRHGARLEHPDELVLLDLTRATQHLQPGEEIFAEGDEPRALFLVTEGWAIRSKLLEDGRRQIISLLIPGDLSEPFGTLPRFVENSTEALTPLTCARIAPAKLRQLAQSNRRIEEALWWDTLMASAIEREHLVSLGRRTAVERLGHLLCELHLRLDMIGLVDDLGCDVPLTQADLGDVLGLSTIHVNRSLQDLRKSGLIALRKRRLTILDLERLREQSLFDAAYLHPEGTSAS